MRRSLFPLLLLTFWVCLAFSQNRSNFSDRSIRIKETKTPILLDGILDDKAWEEAESSNGFFQRFPMDTSMAESQTEVMLSYDENFFYVAAICHRKSGPYVISSLRRDFSTRGEDYFAVILDPFLDKTNGFEFAVSAYGVQRESLITNGGNGRNGSTSSWDNKWFAKTSRDDKGYYVEIAIPFKTLRYKEGGTEWGINFARSESQSNERTNWTHIPRNFRSTSLGFTASLLWDKALKKPGFNMAVIPYITGGVTKNYEEGTERNTTGAVGGDVKIGLGPSLNLDLTINPDFSQVEVDQQVTNLDRFEISFPERRQFFLENNDLFSSFGTQSLRPFFTRRIGIAKDIVTNETVENRIIAGARLSGKLNQDWRVGFLNIQTESDPEIGVPATNYTVGVAQRQVFSRSNISGIVINKESFATNAAEDTLNFPRSFNRVVGMDYNHASRDNKWQGKVFYHKSIGMENLDDEYSHGTSIRYNSPIWEIQWNHEVVGENYDAEVGFIRRTGYRRISPSLEYKYYPKLKLFNRVGGEVQTDYLWSNELGLTDRSVSADIILRFNRGDYLRFGYENEYIKLTSSFDPTRTGGLELETGTEYVAHRFNALFFSDSRRKFNTFFRATHGEYFNGRRSGISGELRYRMQPRAVISSSFSLNRVVLPEPYNTATLILVGPKIDLTFTDKIFFTTLVQYNNQIDNININARFQWRYKPVSDLFIVYTDNYYSSNLNVKNRGIVFKLTYWLNV
ncbi:MAG: DUF5916 domain-containing protein [Bacteroidota bacterium]